MKQAAPISFFVRWNVRPSLVLVLALIFTVFSEPLLADDNPFDLETSSWMSFDRYKEKPSTWIAPEERAKAMLQPVIVPPPMPPPDMPMITPPAHAVVPPVMPGINGRFDVKVSSTEDSNRPDAFVSGDSGDQPGLQLEGKNWKDAVALARHLAEQKKTAPAAADKINRVRFSYLPPMYAQADETSSLAPVKKITAAHAKAAPAVAPPPAVDPAVCAALDAYKKRQLAAIESDRQTLTALQTAIAQLGLQKKLDFMTGAGRSLDMQVGAATDMPASAPAGKN